MLSYDSNTTKSDALTAAPFNQSLWDIHGPIYCGPLSASRLLRRVRSNGDFLVGEVLGFRKYNANDAAATIERVNGIAHRWKTISLTPVVLAPAFSPKAWQALRMLGILPVVFRNVFGRNIEELLRRFSNALSASSDGTEQLDEIEGSLELAQGTVANEGLLGNLKGTLFELLIALAMRAEGFDTILQKVVRRLDKNERYEVDVVAMRGQSHCRLVECKGRNAQYRESVAELRRHFDHRCGAAADAYGWNITEDYKDVEAVFITSGSLDPDAMEYANATKRSHGIKCSFMTRADLLTWLRRLGQERLVVIVETYY